MFKDPGEGNSVMEEEGEAFGGLLGMGTGDYTSLFFNLTPPKERVCSFFPLEG